MWDLQGGWVGVGGAHMGVGGAGMRAGCYVQVG